MNSSMPRILIDARGLQKGFKIHKQRGIGHYAANLINGLLKAESSFQFNFLFEQGLEVDQRLQQHPCIYQIPKWFELKATRMISDQWSLSRSIPPRLFDLFHSLSQGDGLISSPIPSVVSVMDTISISAKDLYPPAQRLKNEIANCIIHRILQNSSRIIAISEHTKKDIITHFAISSDKIRVIPLAVEKRFFQKWSSSDIQEIRSRYDLPEHFLLYVGGIDPRKNVRLIFEALKLLLEENSAACPILAFAGDIVHQREYPQLMKTIHTLGIGNQIRFLGYVPDDELPLLYHSSSMFIFPSRYEGFGLPVLQAMAAGTPVITTRLSSIPEVAGDAACVIDPDKPADLARTITELSSNHHLRTSCAARGWKQAEKFTWERTVQETLEVYREVLLIPQNQ